MIRNILVVDNNPLIVRLVERFLQEEGYTVRTAGDGLAALNILDSFVPDVIFVDLIMPNISGDKLCRVIRAMPSLAKVRLVVLSAIVADEDIDFKSFGADACIAKGPFAQVRENIREVLGHFSAAEKSGAAGDDGGISRVVGLEQLFQRGITRELLDMRQQFNAILGNLSDAVLQLAGPGRIVYLNKTAAELLGRPEEKLLATNLVEYLGEEERPWVAAAIAAPPDQGSVVLGEEQPLRIGERLVRLQVLFITLEIGRERARGGSTWVVMQDVTSRVRQQQEMEKLYNQLLHAEKLNAVGKLAASIAHEFNNPICGIRNVLEGLQRRLTLDEEEKELVALAVRECERIARLTHDLQSFNRPTSGESEELDLHAAIEDLLRLCRKDLENAGIEVARQFAPGPLPVQAVTDQIRQVLLNLLTNAREAISGPGGKITISTALQGQEARLSIADNGPGISQEALPHLFEPFFSTKPVVKGAGLGLSVSYGIIQRHGGRIEAENLPAGGACFTVILPARP